MLPMSARLHFHLSLWSRDTCPSKAELPLFSVKLVYFLFGLSGDCADITHADLLYR